MPRLIDQGVNLIKYSFKKKYLLNLCTEKQEVTLTKKSSLTIQNMNKQPKKGKALTVQTISDSLNWEDNAGSQGF